jgi:hypothetical protein
MRVQVVPSFRRIVAALIAVAGFALSLQSARGQDVSPMQISSAVRTTVVVFPSRPMPDDEWTALYAAAQNIADAEKIEGAGDLEFVRGDTMRPGLRVESAVVVYLHGDCNLEPLPRRTGYSVRLGWVLRVNARIDPYINVDCTRIGQVLGAQAQGLDREARDRMMAGAVARVMVHEWIHVARQSAEHGRNGITKASFGVADLLGEPETQVARRRDGAVAQ